MITPRKVNETVDGRRRALVAGTLGAGALAAWPDRSQGNVRATWGVRFAPVSPGPTLGASRCFDWRCAGAGDPCLGRGPDGRLRLWFTAMGVRREGLRLVPDGPSFGRATFENDDPARPQVRPDHPVVQVGAAGSWNRFLETPSVRLDPSGAR